MIRVDAWWLASAPVDLRCGMDRLLTWVLDVFGEVQPHQAFLFANRSSTRLKVLVHDGQGVWLATRRLRQGHFAWPRHGETLCSLTAEQFTALTQGLHWQHLGQPIRVM